MKKDLLTRSLHLLVGLAVIHQLAVSEWMQPPKDGRPENFAFELHESMGMVTLGIVLAFWIWTLVRDGGTAPGALFPWFSGARRTALFADLRAATDALRGLRLPEAPAHSPLASAVHGLGLLAVTGAAATGTVWLFLESIDRGLAHDVAEIHELMATLVWTYIVGHASLAVLHELAGHRVLRRMFPFGRR